MLELIFQGFVEWIYGLILEAWEYFSNVLLDLMSLDFAYLRSHMPIIDTIMEIMLAVGWALFIGNLVFQAVRSMVTGLGFEAEDPKLLFTRSFAFAFLLLASPQICRLCLDLTSTIIEILQMPDAVNITFADEASFGGLAAAWLLVVICGIIVMFQTFKLIMEMAERYLILSMLTITAPLAFAMGGSRNTSDIFTGWCRMFGSMCVLMVLHVVFVKMLLSALSYCPSGLDVLPWMVLVISIVKVAKKADSILSRMGLNPAMTGDGLGRSLPGMLTYAVVRSMASNVARTVGKSGRGGAAASQSGSPNGPRPASPTGGVRAGNSTNTSYARNQASTSQQTSVHNGTLQEGGAQVPQQTSAQQETQSQSASTAYAASQTQQAHVQRQTSRNTSVPSGQRRAPSHVQAQAQPASAVVNTSSAQAAQQTEPQAGMAAMGTAVPNTPPFRQAGVSPVPAYASQPSAGTQPAAAVHSSSRTQVSGQTEQRSMQSNPQQTTQNTASIQQVSSEWFASTPQESRSPGRMEAVPMPAVNASQPTASETQGPVSGTAGTPRTSIGGRYTQNGGKGTQTAQAGTRNPSTAAGSLTQPQPPAAGSQTAAMRSTNRPADIPAPAGMPTASPQNTTVQCPVLHGEKQAAAPSGSGTQEASTPRSSQRQILAADVPGKASPVTQPQSSTRQTFVQTPVPSASGSDTQEAATPRSSKMQTLAADVSGKASPVTQPQSSARQTFVQTPAPSTPGSGTQEAGTPRSSQRQTLAADVPDKVGPAQSQPTTRQTFVQSPIQTSPGVSAMQHDSIKLTDAGQRAEPRSTQRSVQPGGSSISASTTQTNVHMEQRSTQRPSIQVPASAAATGQAGTAVQESHSPQRTAPNATAARSAPVQQEPRSTQRVPAAAETGTPSAAQNAPARDAPRSTQRPQAPAPAGSPASGSASSARETQRPVQTSSTPSAAGTPVQSGMTQKQNSTSVRQSRNPPAAGQAARVQQETRDTSRPVPASKAAERPSPARQEPRTSPSVPASKREAAVRPGMAGMTVAASQASAAPAARQEPAQAAKKPFVPLTGKQPESIPSHLDLKQNPQKSTKRPDQEEARHGTE